MDQSIVVTGLGVICSIGTNVEECYRSLREKRSGIASIQFLETKHRESFRLGEVKKSNQQLGEMLELSSCDMQQRSRTTLLAMIAAKEALAHSAALNGEKQNTGFVSSTTVGGMDITETKFLREDQDFSYLETHPCGDSTREVAKLLGLTSYYTTINTACSSGTNALIHGMRLLKNGILDRVVVGGVDALTMFTLNGFNSLKILDQEDCRPFDQTRAGLNLAEGAGYIVLERENANEKHLCKLAGCANANDAYHQTASSPTGEGAFLAMSQAIEQSGLEHNQIDYINVHGTGTGNNDLSEGTALERIFGVNKVPKFSSTKSYTGHTLAAAAGLESVFSVLSLVKDIIYPNLNFTTPIEELSLVPNLEVLEGTGVNHVMSNSFGFGGNNSTVIFSK